MEPLHLHYEVSGSDFTCAGEASGKIPDEIVVVLKDTGPGIPDIDLAMQEGWSTAPENIRQLGFGAGMGLPNIKKYSDELKIDSTVGVGTTITITVRNPA